MKGEELRSTLLETLEQNDTRCMDDSDDREALLKALLEKLDPPPPKKFAVEIVWNVPQYQTVVVEADSKEEIEVRLDEIREWAEESAGDEAPEPTLLWDAAEQQEPRIRPADEWEAVRPAHLELKTWRRDPES